MQASMYASYHLVDKQDDTITPHKVEYQYFCLFLEDFGKRVERGNRSRGQGWCWSHESPRAPLIAAPDTEQLHYSYPCESICMELLTLCYDISMLKGTIYSFILIINSLITYERRKPGVLVHFTNVQYESAAPRDA